MWCDEPSSYYAWYEPCFTNKYMPTCNSVKKRSLHVMIQVLMCVIKYLRMNCCNNISFLQHHISCNITFPVTSFPATLHSRWQNVSPCSAVAVLRTLLLCWERVWCTLQLKQHTSIHRHLKTLLLSGAPFLQIVRQERGIAVASMAGQSDCVRSAVLGRHNAVISRPGQLVMIKGYISNRPWMVASTYGCPPPSINPH